MVVGPGLAVSKVEGDLARPDRVRMKATTQVGNSVLDIEFIAIGDQQYIADPFTLRWQSLPTSPVTFTPLDPQRGVPGVVRALKNPQRVGKSQADGVEAYHVRGAVESGLLAALTGTATASDSRTVPVELWVGTQDFLPRQIRLEGRLSDGEPAGIVRSLHLTQYNRPLTIEPPAQ